MAIKINCEAKGCGKELDEQGAILHSPPTNKRTRKVHLCRDCYHWLAQILRLEPLENPDMGKTTCCGENNKPLTERTFC